MSAVQGRTAIILAAGIGSRMGDMSKMLPKPMMKIHELNKSPLEINIDNLIEAGVSNIAVVVGYKDKLITEFIHNRYPDENIMCIYNDNYCQYGCEYSVSVAMSVVDSIFSDVTEVVIVEADTIMDVSYLHKLFNTELGSCYKVLVRSKEFIQDDKSVVCASRTDGYVDEFFYDKNHESVSKVIPEEYSIVGESMQTWYLSDDALRLMKNLCKEYIIGVGNNIYEGKESGVFNLNRVASINPITPVYVEGTRWYNFNKVEDFYEEGKYL